MAKLNSWKGLAERVKSAGSDASFEGIVVKDGRVTHGKESVALAGARLSVDTAGDVERRITATRLVLTGPFALAFRKKKDHRELYITVENNGSMFVVPVDPKAGADARQFVAKVNSLAGPATATAATAATAATEPPDVAGRLRELADLHTAGALSDDEFAAAKSKLLG